MLKHWLGEQNEIDVSFVMESMGVGTPEARAAMRQALIDDPGVPNQYVDEIVDLGLQAGIQSATAALSAIDTTASLGTHRGVREAVSQIGLQVASHTMVTLSKSMIEVLKAAHGSRVTNIAANVR